MFRIRRTPARFIWNGRRKPCERETSPWSIVSPDARASSSTSRLRALRAEMGREHEPPRRERERETHQAARLVERAERREPERDERADRGHLERELAREPAAEEIQRNQRPDPARLEPAGDAATSRMKIDPAR